MKHSPPEVLLIEDDPLQVRVVLAMLGFDHLPRHRLHHADRMSAALAHLQSRALDVVLMDLDLPDSAGLDSLRRVRAAAPQLPVIVLTANADEAMRREAVELGADEYLFKGRVDRHSLERSLTLAIRRKRAQDALHQAQQRFAELAENLDEVFWISGPNISDRSYGSPAYENIWGRPPAMLEADAADWIKAVHAEDLPSVQAALHVAGTGAEYQARYRIVHADGSPRWIQERGRPVLDAAGRVSHMIGFARDISQHKQVEQARDQSEERFRALFLNSPMPTAVTSLSEGRFLRVNESFAVLTGYTVAELQGRTSLELGLWAQPETRGPLAGELQQQGFLKSRAGHLRTKQGTDRHLLISASRVQIGLSDCVILMAEDITAHKQVEEQLRAQARLLDLAHDAIIVCDLDDCVRYWNQGAVTLYGWSAAAGRKLGELCRIESPGSRADREQLLQTGQWFGQIHQRTHSGQQVIVNSRCTLVRDEQGRPQSVLVINTDVTQHKKLEDQFYRAQRLESIGQLAGGVAHDFNNLLTVISGHCELLAADLPRENPMQEAVAQISRAAARAATLTRQLLAFSRQQTLELQVTDLNRVVADVEKMLRRLIEKTSSSKPASRPACPSSKWMPARLNRLFSTSSSTPAMP